MIKKYITITFFLAVCWSFNAEAIMGMSASKALSYSNVVSGAANSANSSSSGRSSLTVKRAEVNPPSRPTFATHTITMTDLTSAVEIEDKTINAGDYLNVILPSFTWDIDMGTCNGTIGANTNVRISFKIEGTTDFTKACQIKLYGFNANTSQMLNKILNITIN